MSESSANAETKQPDCAQLLTADIKYDGWIQTIADQRSFYVRGATWFQETILSETTKISLYTGGIVEILAERPEWFIPGFQWKSKFSPRQAIDTLSLKLRRPLKFFKAVQTIVACEAAARDLNKAGAIKNEPSEVLRRMRVEPAVFYIRDFNEKQYRELRQQRPTLAEDLREFCGQITTEVFAEMSRGHTVTKRLADKTVEYITKNVKDTGIGSVDFRHKHGDTTARPASEKEALL